MKTSVMEVHDMLSVLSVDGVEKRIGDVAGVESVTVNFAAGSATVRYDETRLDIAAIRSDVRQSGFEATPSDAAAESSGHGGHAAPGAPRATSAPAEPETSPAAPATASAVSAGAVQPAKAMPATTPEPSPAGPTTAPATTAATGAGHQHKAVPDKS